MTIYNVTLNVDESIHDQWLDWIKGHIKDVLATKKFEKALLTRVSVEQQIEGITYSIQYTAKSEETLQSYYINDAPRLKKEGVEKFGDKVLAFRSELKIIEEFTV